MKGLIRDQALKKYKTNKQNPQKSKYLDHSDISMKKTILFIFRKHISTTNSKLDLPVYRIASQYYTTSFVAEISEDTVFHAKEKRKNIHQNGGILSLCRGEKKFPAISRKPQVIGGGKRDLVRTCYECRVLSITNQYHICTRSLHKPCLLLPQLLKPH